MKLSHSMFVFQLWCNALMFWTHLQGYHKMFYTEIKDIYNLERKAQVSTLENNNGSYSTYFFFLI